MNLLKNMIGDFLLPVKDLFWELHLLCMLGPAPCRRGGIEHGSLQPICLKVQDSPWRLKHETVD